MASLVLASLPALAEQPDTWTDRIDTGFGDDVSYALAVSPDGAQVFVAGSIAGPLGPADRHGAVAAYDAIGGGRLWFARTGTDQTEGFNAIAISPDGRRVVAAGGIIGSTARSADFLTIAYDAATGERLWESRYDGPGHDVDGAAAVAVSADGSRVFVAGTGWGGPAPAWDGYETVAYDALTGTTLWDARFDGPGLVDLLAGLAVSPDGARVYVTGHSWHGIGPGGTGFDFMTLAYDASSGVKVWSARHDGADQDLAVTVLADAARVFVVGNGPVNGDEVVAYDAETGAERWVARAQGLGAALAATSGGGSVFLAGWTDRLSLDLATAALDVETGAERWSTPYDGLRRGTDYARAIALDLGGGRVYSAGPSESLGTGFDYAVTAFDTANGTIAWTSIVSGDDPRLADSPSAVGVAAGGARIVVSGDSQTTDGLDWLTVGLPASTCSSGRNESGPVSRVVHETEHLAVPGRSTIHGVNCDVIVPAGL